MNVVVIMNDTWRYDCLGANGNGAIHTPVLDQFAAESAVFDRSYAGSYPTVPIRHDLLKGRFGAPFHGWLPLEWDALTLPEVMRRNDFVSMLILSTPHLINYGYGFDRPFHAWEMIRGADIDRWNTDYFQEYALPAREKFNSDEHLALYHRGRTYRRIEAEMDAPRVMQSACDWLERNAGHDRFFLWVDSFDPHEPWDPPDHYIDLYSRDYAGDDIFWPKYTDASFYTPEEAERMRARYMGEITMSDRWIGCVLDTIDRVGRRHDTIVIVMSDHGHLFGEHDRVSKWGAWLELWDECAHQFFMVRHPDRLGAGKRIGGLIQPADLAPSILEMVGIDAPAEMGIQGQSWLPLLDGRKRSLRPAAISAFHPRQGTIDGCHNHLSPDGQWTAATVTDRRWQLIDFPSPRRRELYDLSNEGGSLRNVLAGNEVEADRLHDHLLRFFGQHDAPDWLLQAFRDGPDAAIQPPVSEWRQNVQRRSTPRANTPPGNVVG